MKTQFTSEKREGLDFYSSPHKATKEIIPYLDPTKIYWEPCVGIGGIAIPLMEAGLTVKMSDVYDYGLKNTKVLDFSKTKKALGDIIITNPPYNRADEFIQRALALNVDEVWMLLRLGFLTGIERAALFEDPRYFGCYVFRGRLGFHIKPDQSDHPRTGVDYAWYRWTKNNNKIKQLLFVKGGRRG